MGTTRFGVVVLAAAVLTLAAAFFDFPAERLVATVVLVSVFCGLAFYLVAITLFCSGTFVTAQEED